MLFRSEVLLAALLTGAAQDGADREALESRRLRIGRYRGELHHKNGSHGIALAVFNPIRNDPIMLGVFERQLAGQALLQRAQFHELHACARARLAAKPDASGALRLPETGVTRVSITASWADYDHLVGQLDPKNCAWPKRLWRWIMQSDRTDGSSELREHALAGLQRLKDIEACRW